MIYSRGGVSFFGHRAGPTMLPFCQKTLRAATKCGKSTNRMYDWQEQLNESQVSRKIETELELASVRDRI